MWALTTLSQRERQLAYGMVHGRTLSFLTARSELVWGALRLFTYLKRILRPSWVPCTSRSCGITAHIVPVPAISCLRWHITLSNRRTSVVECRLDRCDLSNWDNDTNPERFRRTYFIAYKMIGDVTPRAWATNISKLARDEEGSGHARIERLILLVRPGLQKLPEGPVDIGRPRQLSRKLCGRVLKYLSKLYKSHIDIDNKRQRKHWQSARTCKKNFPIL